MKYSPVMLAAAFVAFVVGAIVGSLIVQAVHG